LKLPGDVTSFQAELFKVQIAYFLGGTSTAGGVTIVTVESASVAVTIAVDFNDAASAEQASDRFASARAAGSISRRALEAALGTSVEDVGVPTVQTDAVYSPPSSESEPSPPPPPDPALPADIDTDIDAAGTGISSLETGKAAEDSGPIIAGIIIASLAFGCLLVAIAVYTWHQRKAADPNATLWFARRPNRRRQSEDEATKAQAAYMASRVGENSASSIEWSPPRGISGAIESSPNQHTLAPTYAAQYDFVQKAEQESMRIDEEE